MKQPLFATLLRAAILTGGQALALQTFAQAEGADTQDEQPEAVPTIPVENLKSDAEPAPVGPEEPQALDSVTVTSGLRKQALYEVTSSIAVVSGEEIQNRGMVNMEQVTRSLPNVNINQENLLSIYTVRGMGAQANYGFDPSITAVIDDVPLPIGALVYSFLDLSSIELLRGPQGTLYGKNTIAGAIKVATKEPHSAPEAIGTALYGSYSGRKIEAVGNIPIGDESGVRIRYAGERRDGYIQNTARDEDDGGIDKSAIGGKARFALAEDLSLTLNGVYNTHNLPQGYGYQAVVCPDSYSQQARAFDPDFECEPNQKSSRDYEEGANTNALITSGVLSWTFNDYELKGLVAYYKYDFPFTYDADYTAVPAYTLPVHSYGNSWSSELRLISPTDLQLWDRDTSFVSGLYINNENTILDTTLNIYSVPCSVSPTTVGGVAPNVLGLLDGFDISIPCGLSGGAQSPAVDNILFFSDKKVTELAAFGQADHDLSEKLTLTAGARLSRVRSTARKIQVEETCAGVSFNCLGTAGGFVNDTKENLSRIDQAANFKVALGYKLSRAVKLYASAASGFKPGGYGMYLFDDGNGGSIADEFEPERSISYEIGAKTKLFGGLGQVNFALFRSRFDDFQVRITRLVGTEAANAAAALTQGGEIESRWLLATDFGKFFLLGNVGYVDATYLDYRNTSCPASETGVDSDNNPATPAVCDLSGRQLANAPKWKAAVLLDAQIPLGSWPMLFTLGSDTAWTSRTYFQPDTDPVDSQKSFLLTNFRVGLAGASGNWRLSFFVDNVTDKVFLQSSDDIPLVAGAHYGSVGAPRWYSVAFTYRFGE